MKKIIGILMTGFLLIGCSDFLKEDNKAGIINDDLYSTAVGYETLMTASYATLRNVYGTTPWLLLGGTDLYQKSKLNTYLGMYEYTSLYASDPQVKDFYTKCYAAIQVINSALYYNDFPKDLDEETRNIYKSELRFLRAFYHFLLVEQFGGISINSEITTTPRTNIPRNSLAECYEFIISEMEDCLHGLEPTNVGRINQDAAHHYLAKIYLTRGWDLNNSGDFTKAKSYAQKVFDSRGEICLTYEDLWSWENENNSEILFAVQYDNTSLASYSSGHIQQGLFCPYMGGAESLSKYNPALLAVCWAVHMWYPENDVRYENSFMMTCYEYYFDYYTVDDKSTLKVRAFLPRVWGRPYTEAELEEWKETHEVLDQLRFFPFIEDEEVYRAHINMDFWTPPLKKFDSPASREYAHVTQTSSVRDIVLARLGETYFLYAEACIGLDDYSTAASYVQKVLDRPGNVVSGTLPNALMGATTKEDALHGYLIESGKEFVGEYNGRWPELRRTGMLKYMLELYNYDIKNLGVSLDFNKYKLRPIPEDAIILNEGISEEDQNPGY